MEGMIEAYSVAMQHVFHIVAATASVSFVCSWGLRWKSVWKSVEEAKFGALEVLALVVVAENELMI